MFGQLLINIITLAAVLNGFTWLNVINTGYENLYNVNKMRVIWVYVWLPINPLEFVGKSKYQNF